MSNHNTYAICSLATDLSNINFNEIPETSADTIRKSINETLFVIKWITEPEFVTDGTVTPSEIRQMAHKNHNPKDRINASWHPVYIDECRKINRKAIEESLMNKYNVSGKVNKEVKRSVLFSGMGKA